MNTFFDKMRSSAGKAAFEADKLRRVALIQSDLRGLRDEFQKLCAQAGQIAFSLHQRGQIGPPELQAICDQLAAVHRQMGDKEAEADRIRNEPYVDPGAAPAGPTLLCPQGHGPIPPGARFCQLCGQPGAPAGGWASAPAGGWTSAPVCATCGDTLLPDAAFCANCGAPTGGRPAVPPPSSALPPRPPTPGLPVTERLGGSPAALCPSCAAPLADPGAPRCPTCGYSLQRPAG
jgi:hypothetical protein